MGVNAAASSSTSHPCSCAIGIESSGCCTPEKFDELIERETLAIFGADISNQKLIAVSVRIKEARELLAAGRVDGAVLLATEARVALLRRGGAPATHVKPRVAAPASFEALLLSWAGDEEAPMGETLRADVVPWYRSLYAQAPSAAKTGAQVKVTLVRWPYT